MSDAQFWECESCKWVFEAELGTHPKCSRCGAQKLRFVPLTVLMEKINTGELVWCEACKCHHLGCVQLARPMQE